MAGSTQLNGAQLERKALAAKEPPTMSGRFAWRLAQGAAVNPARLGIGKATVAATVAALRGQGWEIETQPRRGHPDGTVYSLTARPGSTGLPVPPEAPPTPLEPQGGGNGAGSRRGAQRGELGRLRALHSPAPLAPPVGTVLRVTMVTDNNGVAVVALRDIDGAVWFASVEGRQ